jgi:hypothetical protein
MEGISLNPRIYKQKRFREATNDIGLTAFIPTRFVTGNIFKEVYKRGRAVLLEGQYGISKTFSFVLFQQLSNYTVDYKLSVDKHS